MPAAEWLFASHFTRGLLAPRRKLCPVGLLRQVAIRSR
jgi:hypothetical protein